MKQIFRNIMNYTEAINSAATVLVEFYASWCPHCQRMMPIVDQVKELLDGKVDVYQLDIDNNKQLADEQDIQSIPTFIVYSHGKEMWRQSGEISGEVLLANVQKYI